MISRVGMFWFMGAWGGWHGRFATLLWPPVLLLAGMSLALLAPSALVLAIGLAFFGMGMGAIYASAFYYAMEVGSAGVDAGGKHEAFIGVGYAIGPLLGTAAGGAAASLGSASATRESVTLALIVVLFFGFAVVIRRAARPWPS
jgi:MFS family permease